MYHFYHAFKFVYKRHWAVRRILDWPSTCPWNIRLIGLITRCSVGILTERRRKAMVTRVGLLLWLLLRGLLRWVLSRLAPIFLSVILRRLGVLRRVLLGVLRGVLLGILLWILMRVLRMKL